MTDSVIKKYKVQSVSQKTGKNGAYWFVETTDGLKFNVFEPEGAHLRSGIEFECALWQKGEYWNISKGTFSINMSTAFPDGHQANPDPDHMSKGDWEDKDSKRQRSIEAQNALTNLTEIVCHHTGLTDGQRTKLTDELITELKLRAGLPV